MSQNVNVMTYEPSGLSFVSLETVNKIETERCKETERCEETDKCKETESIERYSLIKTVLYKMIQLS